MNRGSTRSTAVVVTGLYIRAQVERSVAEEVDELDEEERAWLEERLREYRDLLLYLHDH